MRERRPDVPATPLAIASAFVAAVAIGSAPPAFAADPPAFAEVLRRAHNYVIVYEDHALSTVLADEYYEQQVLSPDGQVKERRTMRSDFGLYQLPPEEDWFALRDVYEVDGQPVRDREARLEELFKMPAATITERATAIAKEGARFNLGDVLRTINVPTFPLRFLRPASRTRFEFKAAGEETIAGTRTVVVAYREKKKPTFIATPEGEDVPASGRFWIEPDTGTIVRTELIVGGTRRVPRQATVTVTYREEPALGFRVPATMEERYESPRRRTVDVITGKATYSGFRKFDARTLLRD